MSSRVPLVLSSLALVCAVVAIVIALASASGSGTPPPVVPRSQPAADDVGVPALASRLDALERRLAALAATSAGAERTVAAAPAPEPAAVEARLAKVEAAVDAIAAELAGLGPMPDTVAGIVKALADKNLFGHDASPQQVQRRRELWTRLLELAPRDPQAPAILEQLCNDYLGQDPRQSLALLERYERLVDLPALRADRLRANCLLQAGDADGARAIYARIAADRSLTEDARVGAMFWHAYVWKRQGQYDDARREFEALIATYGNASDPEIVSYAQGARAQIEEMERWRKQQR
jgi:tetratricopeptide (TPR) repeat protein